MSTHQSTDGWRATGFPVPATSARPGYWQFSEILAWIDRQPFEMDIGDARKKVFKDGRKKSQTPEVRKKAAATKRRRKNQDAEVNDD